MAVAYGLEYGLADIQRANAAITQELRQQKQLTENMLATSTGYRRRGGSGPAFELGAGESAVGNIPGHSEERDLERRIDRYVDKKMQSGRARMSGRMGAEGRFSAVRNVAMLTQGQASPDAVFGLVRGAAHVTAGTSMGAHIARVLPMLGVAAAAAPIAIGVAQEIKAAFTGEVAKEYNRALSHAQKSVHDSMAGLETKSANRFITDLIENEKSLAPLRFDDGDRRWGERMAAQAGMAADIAKRIGSLSKAAPLMTKILDMRQRPNRAYGDFYDPGELAGLAGGRALRGTASDLQVFFAALAKQGKAADWLGYAENVVKYLGEKQMKQKMVFDRDPEAASWWHEEQRRHKRQQKLEDEKLMDWSRS